MSNQRTQCDRCGIYTDMIDIFPDGWGATEHVYLCGECVNDLEREDEDDDDE